MLSGDHSNVENLSSGVSTSPADGLLQEAIAAALASVPSDRARFLAERLREIKNFMAEGRHERPWTFAEFTGTDGSHIFRGGVGHSLVVDSHGGIWRARSYEDFETTYTITETECHIATLTPLYREMRRCGIE
jgi:hypothetical protein